MRKNRMHSFVLASVAAATLIATPALAGSPYYPSPDAQRSANGTPPHGAGHYTCSFNELKTKLESKNCGHYRY